MCAVDIFMACVREGKGGFCMYEIVTVSFAHGYFCRGYSVVHFYNGFAIWSAEIRDVVKEVEGVFAHAGAIIVWYSADRLLIDDPRGVFHEPRYAGDSVVALG